MALVPLGRLDYRIGNFKYPWRLKKNNGRLNIGIVEVLPFKVT
jgi:hypothetical protein